MFSSAGSSSCTQCPAGFSCTVNGTLAACTLGLYSPLGDSSCTICPSNHICPPGSPSPQVHCFLFDTCLK